jgi:hypothetical protein
MTMAAVREGKKEAAADVVGSRQNSVAVVVFVFFLAGY